MLTTKNIKFQHHQKQTPTQLHQQQSNQNLQTHSKQTTKCKSTPNIIPKKQNSNIKITKTRVHYAKVN